MAWLWLFVSVAGYLGGARLVFWGLTRIDWPKSRSRNHCGHARAYHRHNPELCKEGRDLIKSRDRRVVTTYFWPLVFPFVLAVALVLLVIRGSYKTMTYPITNPGERRARRLALEQDVAAAEEAAREAEHPPRHASPGRGQQAVASRPVPRVRTPSGSKLHAQPPIEYHASYDDDY
jgi:hypothetical protein